MPDKQATPKESKASSIWWTLWRRLSVLIGDYFHVVLKSCIYKMRVWERRVFRRSVAFELVYMDAKPIG